MARGRRRNVREHVEAARAVEAAANAPPPAIREAWRCPAALGREHDFTMKGSDGVLRCWYCVKTKGDLGLKCNACGREG